MAIANITGNILTDSGVSTSSLVSGSGTTNYLPKFTGASTLGNSLIYDNGTNVGIGTANPQMPLSVQANTGNGAIRLIGTSNASSNNAGIYWYDSNDSTFNGYLGNFSSSFDIYNQRSTPIAFYTAATERMRITSAGLVRINTTSTLGGGILGLNGNLEFGGTAGGNYRITNYQAGFLAFDTDNTERMRITSGGNIGIGAAGNTDVRARIQGVDSTSSNYALAVSNSVPYDLFLVRNDGLINTGTRSGSPYNNTSGAAANMVVNSQGTLERSTSSLKYKKEVRDYDKGLSEVIQMRPVYYKGKGENDGDKQFAGLIAEEIDALGLNEFVVYAEDGSPDALAYQNMIALLTKAIQELNAKVSALENKS